MDAETGLEQKSQEGRPGRMRWLQWGQGVPDIWPPGGAADTAGWGGVKLAPSPLVVGPSSGIVG